MERSRRRTILVSFLMLSAVVFIILSSAVALVYSLPFVLNTQHPIEMIRDVSMQNTYFEGDVVILRGIPTRNIQVGDVVGYQRGGSFIIHRVTRIVTRNDGTIVSFVTQGDNRETNPIPDTPVSPSNIAGTVVYRIPAWPGRAVYSVVSTFRQPFFPALPAMMGLVVIILLVNMSIEEKKTRKRFCKYCGMEIRENAIYCGECGKRIAS